MVNWKKWWVVKFDGKEVLRTQDSGQAHFVAQNKEAKVTLETHKIYETDPGNPEITVLIG